MKTDNNPMHPKNNAENCQQKLTWQSALDRANQSPRCGAKTRKQTACQSPAMPNGRCRMHGGKSAGAPYGNQNAYKTGEHTAHNKAFNRAVSQLAREAREMYAKPPRV